MAGPLLQERVAVVTGAEVLPADVDDDLARQAAFEVGGGRLM